MNGIKYIREKSNFTKNALAERMGVTRQTVTMWEQGRRKPGKGHLKWLCEFYGIEEKWFRELPEEDIAILDDMKMYCHREGDKEYFTFTPEIDGWGELSVRCGALEGMLDETYVEVVKKKRIFMQRIEQYLSFENEAPGSLFNKILVANRGMNDIEKFLDLMDLMQKIGTDNTFLKIPFRYEIITAVYAMMVTSGIYSVDEIKEKYPNDFESEHGVQIDEEYLNQLAEMTCEHWATRKDEEIGRVSGVVNTGK